MESVLKSFSIGFLLRSLFAGVFFLISYRVTGDGVTAIATFESASLFAIALPVALIAGVTVYSLHRSLVYPFIEHFLNSKSAVAAREPGCWPLISGPTVDVLRRLWALGAENGKINEAFGRHANTWADYSHLQYASALSVALGSFARTVTTPGGYGLSWILIAGFVTFFVGAVTSDWRLHSVREQLRYGES